MDGYISIADEENEVQVVAVENEVGFYRGEDHKIFLEKGDGDHELGVRDVTVSSRRSDGPPITIRSNEKSLSIHNNDNTNAITVRSLRDEAKISKDEYKDVRDDCLIELGYTAEVLLTVEESKTGSEEIDTTEGTVTVSAYVSALCEHFRRAAHESKSETQRRAQQLLDTISDHPVEGNGFEQAKKRLADELDNMKHMGDAELDNGKFKDNERIQRYKRLAHRLEDMYMRK